MPRLDKRCTKKGEWNDKGHPGRFTCDDSSLTGLSLEQVTRGVTVMGGTLRELSLAEHFWAPLSRALTMHIRRPHPSTLTLRPISSPLVTRRLYILPHMVTRPRPPRTRIRLSRDLTLTPAHLMSLPVAQVIRVRALRGTG